MTREQRLVTLAALIFVLLCVLVFVRVATADTPSSAPPLSERMFADVTPAPRSAIHARAERLAFLSSRGERVTTVHDWRSGAPTPTAALRIPDATSRVTDAAVRDVAQTPATAQPSPAISPLPAGASAARSGTASTYGPGWDGWIALPEGPGWRIRVCGAGGCATRTSVDAGPDLAAQRDGRIIDLDVPTFEVVCGVPWRMGLCPVSVTYLGRVR